MRYIKSLLLFTLLIMGHFVAWSQVTMTPATTNTDSTLVEILQAQRLTIKKINDSTTLQIIAGAVRLKHQNTFFDCDSCVLNDKAKTFEAWGHVHINDSDTTHVFANHLRYLTDKKIAYLDGSSRLTDGKGTLTTPDLEYDLSTNIGIYKHGGKVVNGKTVLTSKEGYYYGGLRDIYFKNNVILKDPGYDIKTDSLLYNTETKLVRFIAETFIRDSSGRTVKTKDGFYNLQTGKAEFGQRSEIHDKNLFATGDQIMNDDSAGVIQLRGNAIVIDSLNNTTVLGGMIYVSKKNSSFLATNKPLMILKQEKDSIYITADTLFSARLSDLYGNKDSLVTDTLKGKKAIAFNDKDSTNRYFEAFRHVRIFSDSLQAVADSMFYSFKDSVFRLFQDPIIWAKESQVTGDTILVFTKNKKADRMKVFENSFLINKMDPEVYNQIKSIRMDAYFKEGSIDSVRARGFAECVYYIQDADSAYTGINQSKSDIMDIYFREEGLYKVVFRSAVTGTVWPMKQKNPSEMKLPNFRWLDDRRPKTKYELF